MRAFQELSSDLREKLPFLAVKDSHRTSVVFPMAVWGPQDEERLCVKWREEDADLEHTSVDDFTADQHSATAPVYLVSLGVTRLNSDWRQLFQQVRSVSVPNSVTEIHDNSFYWCGSLRRVKFGESSLLRRIGVSAFERSGLTEIRIPDTVEEIDDRCFFMCNSLTRVRFGEFSMLQRIGSMAFQALELMEIWIPNSVEEIGGECFISESLALENVTFGKSCPLKRIGFREFGCLWLLSHVRLPEDVD